MTASRKLVITAALFAAALVIAWVAALTHGVGPLFAAWAPLLAVPYVLTRPEPGVDDVARPEPGAGQADSEQAVHESPGPEETEPEQSGDS